MDRAEVGRLRLTGSDRRAYLQGLLTNDIAALAPGTGCYAAMLTAQGRMITDMRVLELGDEMIVEAPSALAEPVRAHLERFVFSEDVQVADVTSTRAEIGVYGPDAARLVETGTGARDLARLPLHGSVRAASGAVVVRGDAFGIDGFDLIAAASELSALGDALRGAGAVRADAADEEAVRIESGRPLFGIDMDADTIPLEAGLEDRAISRTKGCYVGQEVIVRVIDRGHGRVARHLAGLLFAPDAPLPAAGVRLLSGDREVGRVTSAVFSPSLARPVALGYVHRDFAEPGTALTTSDGVAVTVHALPFVG